MKQPPFGERVTENGSGGRGLINLACFVSKFPILSAGLVGQKVFELFVLIPGLKCLNMAIPISIIVY